jgi:sugar-specific transcriptional regulator TrmB
MIEELKSAGLTDNEAKIYLALLETGPTLAGRISRKTGLHRRTVYDTTEMLIKKGLIGYILQNHRRLFSAVNPDRILGILQEKQNILLPVVTELKERFGKTKEKEETNFYKGKEGIKTVFEDQLNYSEILILGASARVYDVLPFYVHWYEKKRKSKKVRARIITQDKNFKVKGFADVRYLPEKYSNPLSVNVYGDNVAIFLWQKETPFAIVIQNKDIAEGYRNYFELMWKIAKN